MSDFLLQHGISLAISLGILGLLVAVYLIFFIRGCPTGTDKMREVANAIQEGAKAYLRRQVITVSCIAALLFIVILWLRSMPDNPTAANPTPAWQFSKGWPVAIGFVLGATCSLVAGYIGMRVAVISNVRVA